MPLSAIQTVRKTGKETFTSRGKALPINILSFWQWSSSELLGNALRGVLAEFIVASALHITKNLREEWDAYDLITTSGLKIEIKSSAYLQSWEQDRLSKIVFGIQTTKVWKKNNKRSKRAARQADIYIFCVLSHQCKSTVNPLNLDQWDFYILDTKVLNELLPTQKSITLSSLLKLKPKHVKYNQLNAVISHSG